MRRFPLALTFLCALFLVGCGFLDNDIHKSDAELEMSGGGIGIGSFSMSGRGCGIGGLGHLKRKGARAHHHRSGRQIHMGETHIRGSVHTQSGDHKTGREVELAREAPVVTPVGTVAEHAETQRRDAVREFMR